MPPIKANRRAAPPMEAPAMPPPLSLDESWVAAAAEDDCAGGEEDAGAEDVDCGGDVDAGPVPELVGTPLGPRFSYGAQSGLGKAKGQDGS